MEKCNEYDIIVLGAGMAGTILSAILAKNGIKVAMIDSSSHPRMAIGESTIPLTSSLFRALAERYKIPELFNMTSFKYMRKNISASNGIKNNFGFVMHHVNSHVNPKETNQVVIPALLDVEHHLFRQDIDSYLHMVALKYGAHSYQNVKVEGIEVDDFGVDVQTNQGRFRCRYLCDASGYHSPVANKFNLRDIPPRNSHHSRGLFTHMIDVKPFDDCLSDEQRTHQPRPWHQGTLHHIFDGGWMWVIPFNNCNQTNNQVTSVGFLLDPRRFPKPEGDPENEFKALVDRYPDIKKQFANAKAIRPWVSSNRIQFSSHKMFVNRIGLTAHASGFVDALFSQGLAITLSTVNMLAQRLIDACAVDDFSPENFESIEKVAQAMIDRHDKIVNASFIAFRSFELWNAVVRVWALNAFLSTFYSENILGEFKKTNDLNVFKKFEIGPCFGAPIPNQRNYDCLLDEVVNICNQVESNQLEADIAAKMILRLIEKSDIVPPAFGLENKDKQYFNATPLKILKTIKWSLAKSDPQVGSVSRGAFKSFIRRKILKL